jgi:hypothetical protein
VQITAAAAMAANVLDIMTEYLPLLVVLGREDHAEASGGHVLQV